MIRLRALLARIRPAHQHQLDVTGPEGSETYWCRSCVWTYQRERAPRPPVGKAF